MISDILLTFLLVTILPFIVLITCYHYTKYRSKQTTNKKMEKIIYLKKFASKIVSVVTKIGILEIIM